GIGRALVALLVHGGGVPVRNERCPPPPQASGDQYYLELVTTASSLASAQLKQRESAEMQLYAGMADAAAARLYSLRGENRNTARFGVRARDHFLRAKALDPGLADADFGLGLYNYYVDTLSAMAKIMRFFMGIPGGSKQEGIRLLEHAIADGILTPNPARFSLAALGLQQEPAAP